MGINLLVPTLRWFIHKPTRFMVLLDPLYLGNSDEHLALAKKTWMTLWISSLPHILANYRNWEFELETLCISKVNIFFFWLLSLIRQPFLSGGVVRCECNKKYQKDLQSKRDWSTCLILLTILGSIVTCMTIGCPRVSYLTMKKIFTRAPKTIIKVAICLWFGIGNQHLALK